MEPVTDKKTIFRGDTKSYEFILKRNGGPITLTGYTPYFTARDELEGTLLFSKACAIVEATEGRCQVTLSSADTATLVSNGIAEVVLVDGSNNEDTLGQFNIDIVQDVKTS